MRNEQQNERQIDWLSNEYNNKHLDFCCKECNISCKVHYYDEYSVKPCIRTFDRGVSKDKAKYQIELAMYKDHYFIYEKLNTLGILYNIMKNSRIEMLIRL